MRTEIELDKCTKAKGLGIYFNLQLQLKQGTFFIYKGCYDTQTTGHIFMKFNRESFIQASLILHNLLLHHSALMWLENLYHFQSYTIIFSLTWFGIADMW
jgi:hypothetical protein